MTSLVIVGAVVFVIVVALAAVLARVVAGAVSQPDDLGNVDGVTLAAVLVFVVLIVGAIGVLGVRVVVSAG